MAKKGVNPFAKAGAKAGAKGAVKAEAADLFKKGAVKGAGFTTGAIAAKKGSKRKG